MKRGGGGASEEATMELTALAGNAQIKAQLAHREGDLAHAYIVAGPAGSGRHTLAAQMAAAPPSLSSGPAAVVPIAEKPPGASIPTSP